MRNAVRNECNAANKQLPSCRQAAGAGARLSPTSLPRAEMLCSHFSWMNEIGPTASRRAAPLCRGGSFACGLAERRTEQQHSTSSKQAQRLLFLWTDSVLAVKLGAIRERSLMIVIIILISAQRFSSSKTLCRASLGWAQHFSETCREVF